MLEEHPPPWRSGTHLRYVGRYAPETALLLGRMDEAGELANHALAFARSNGERGFEAAALRLRGWLGASQTSPDVQAAESSYREALALGEQLGMRPLIAHCHLGLGKLYRCTDKRDEAHDHLSTATMMYREMDMRIYLNQTEAVMKEMT